MLHRARCPPHNLVTHERCTTLSARDARIRDSCCKSFDPRRLNYKMMSALTLCNVFSNGRLYIKKTIGTVMTVNGITRITRRGIRVIIESIFKLNSSDPTVSCVIAPRITLSLAYE